MDRLFEKLTEAIIEAAGDSGLPQVVIFKPCGLETRADYSEAQNTLEDDGLGGPVDIHEYSWALNQYMTLPRESRQDPLDRCQDGKVYLAPHFRGFLWAMFDQDIPSNMRPEFYQGKDIDEKVLVKAADRAFQYRQGFKLARQLANLPQTQGELASFQEDSIRLNFDTYPRYGFMLQIPV